MHMGSTILGMSMPGGGGGGGEANIEDFQGLNADHTINNSTTLETALTWPVSASTNYALIGFGYVSSAAAADFKYTVAGPSGATVRFIGQDIIGSTTNGGSTRTFATSSTGVYTAFTFMALCAISTTAGNVTLQWAQNTADLSDSNLRKGTCGFLYSMA